MMMQILGSNHHEALEAPLPVSPADRQKLKRARKGECPECGTKLFQKTGLGRKGVPVNVAGKCFNGRCLVCFPISAIEKATGKIASASEAEANKPKVPETISFAAKKEPDWIENGGTVLDNGNGAFGMLQSFDDNVSVITLDRMILMDADDSARIASVSGTTGVFSGGLFRKSKRALVGETEGLTAVNNGNDKGSGGEEDDAVTEEIRARMEQLLNDTSELVPWEVPENAADGEVKARWEAPNTFLPPQEDTDLKDLNPANMKQLKTARGEALRHDKKQKWAPAMFIPPSTTPGTAVAAEPNDIVLDIPVAQSDERVTSGHHAESEIPSAARDHENDEQADDLAVFDPTDFDEEDCEGSLDMDIPEEESPDEYSEYSSKLLQMLEGSLNADSKPPPLTSRQHVVDDENAGGMISTSEETSPVTAEDAVPPASRLETCPPAPDDGFASQKRGRKKPPPSMVMKLPPLSRKNASPKKPPPKSITAELRLKDDNPIDDNSTDLILLLGRLEHGRTEDHDFAMKKLTQLVWDQGVTSKRNFVANDGVRILTAVMWSDMDVLASERSAMELFLCLVATQSTVDATHSTDELMIHPDAEGLVDALLIVMQTLTSDDILQQAGCKILSALAVNGFENDGTQSGACIAVLNAMDAHSSSPVVQEWGLRALFNQCAHSKFAATNKRTLLSSKLDTSHATGATVLERILLSHCTSDINLMDGSLLDWSLQLFWCLTSSPDAVSELVSLRIETMRDLILLLERCRSVEDASSGLQESILGIFSNRVRMAQYQDFLGTVDVLLLVLDVMHGNKDHLGIQIEACNMIANVSTILAPGEKDELAGSGAVQTIVGALFAFEKNKAVLQEPVLRALVGVSINSNVTKDLICEADTLSVLMQICKPTDGSIPQHDELLCALLASVYVSETARANALELDTVSFIARTAASNLNSEKVQESACTAYRNLCTDRPGLDFLLRHNAVATLLHAMSVFRMSKSIQMNGCATLCRIGLGTDHGREILYEAGAVNDILSAVQMHLDTQEVMENASEALWCLVSKFPELCEQFLDHESSIENVLSIFLMHARSPVLVERACGILACSSSMGSSTFTPALVSDGIESVVDAMRNNAGCYELQLHSVYFLRRAITENPTFAERIRGAIPLVLDALKDPAQSDMFLHEACSLLWTAAETSFEIRTQIISMNGQAVLVDVLNHRGMAGPVERAAIGVLDELEQTRSHQGNRPRQHRLEHSHLH